MTHVAIVPSRQKKTRMMRYGTSVLEGDCRQATAVVAHPRQGVAAVAEKIVGAGQRIVTGDARRDSDLGDAPLEIAREIEQEVAGARCGAEEGFVGFVLGEEGRGKFRPDLVGVAADAGTDRLVSRIAQHAAPRVATLMGRPPAFEARAPGQVAAGVNIPDPNDPAAVQPAATGAPAQGAPPVVKVMVGTITGAPSDGNRQLFSGMRRALGSNKIVVVDQGGSDTYTVAATVHLAPIDDRQGQLVVRWILKDPNGKEVGNIEQSNPVPLAAARGSWVGFGDIVAAAAVEGVLELLEKALNKAR